MRSFVLAGFLALTCACNRPAGFHTSGGMSRQLLLSSHYQASDQQFEITISNESNSTLGLAVDSHQFHGRIVAVAGSGASIEYLDCTFVPLLLTGDWDVPTCRLKPHEKITWVIPISRLCDIQGGKLDSKALQGVSVHATLEELAVIPWSGGYVSDNARQTSAPGIIPE